MVYLSGDGREFVSRTTFSSAVFSDLEPSTTYSVDIQARFEWGLGPRLGGIAVAKTQGAFYSKIVESKLLFFQIHLIDKRKHFDSFTVLI